MATFIEAINAAKPKESKGQYIRSVTLTTTMGPGIHLDLGPTLAMKPA
jgi:large subunit ribosomal protein L1